MLEIICTASLAWSINACQTNELITLAGIEKGKISDIFQQNTITLNREYLTEYIVYESDYRREADRERERLEIRDQDLDNRDRDYRDGQQRRREIEYGEDHRDRNYRDAQQRRREIEYGEDHRDRNYRDAQQRRREIEDDEDHRDRYERRNRSREEYIRMRKNESFQDFFENWF